MFFSDCLAGDWQAIEYYWPGFALLLAPFEFLKVPWLCNASLAAWRSSDL